MGLLDALFPQNDSGGLLDFLKQNAMGQSFPSSGAPGDQAQYGAPAMPAAYQPGQIQAAPLPMQPQPIPQQSPQAAPMVQPQPAMPPQQDPQQQPLTQPQASQGGFMPFYQNLHGGGGLIGSIMAGITGQRNDPQGAAQQQQAQVQNKTVAALKTKGIPDEVAIAAVQPGNGDLLKKTWDSAFGDEKYTFHALPDGTVVSQNARTGEAQVALKGSYGHFRTVKIGETENEFGAKRSVFGVEDQSTGKVTPLPSKYTGDGTDASLPAGANPTAGTGLLDSSAFSPDLSHPGSPQLVPGTGNPATAAPGTGGGKYGKPGSFVESQPNGYLNKGVQNYDTSLPADQYLQQFSPEVQADIKAYTNGTAMPTRPGKYNRDVKSFAAAYGDKTGQEVDDTTFYAKKKLRMDLAASTPNSAGGIISNGKSAFAHLGDLSDKAVDLGNYAGPDIPGGGHIASASNYVTNRLLPTSQTKGKLTGFNDNALKYGQEATKFYAGTGGGVAERMNALKELDPTSSTADQQAAFLETEKSLMMDRLRAKESQVREQLGQDYLDKHPVITPDVTANIKKIDANVAKLRGGAPDDAPAQNAPAQNTTKSGVKWSVEP